MFFQLFNKYSYLIKFYFLIKVLQLFNKIKKFVLYLLLLLTENKNITKNYRKGQMGLKEQFKESYSAILNPPSYDFSLLLNETQQLRLLT